MFICLDCGSIEWIEIVKEERHYTISESGTFNDVKFTDEEILDTYCAFCKSRNLVEFFTDSESAKKLTSIQYGKERLKEFILMVLENKIYLLNKSDKEKLIKILKDMIKDKKELDDIMVKII